MSSLSVLVTGWIRQAITTSPRHPYDRTQSNSTPQRPPERHSELWHADDFDLINIRQRKPKGSEHTAPTCAMRAVTSGELCTTIGISSKMSSQPSLASFSFSDDRLGPALRYSSMHSSRSLIAYTQKLTHPCGWILC